MAEHLLIMMGGIMRLVGQFWPGVTVGVGMGLLLGAALVEQELLAPGQKAWASVIGILLVVVGNVVSRQVRRRDSAAGPARE